MNQLLVTQVNNPLLLEKALPSKIDNYINLLTIKNDIKILFLF